MLVTLAPRGSGQARPRTRPRQPAIRVGALSWLLAVAAAVLEHTGRHGAAALADARAAPRSVAAAFPEPPTIEVIARAPVGRPSALSGRGRPAAAAPAARIKTCDPAAITATDNAGCGRFLPRYHPKNAPLAHNNDANAPFFFAGHYHLFMQADFPGVAGWNGAIGIAHLASPDGVKWKQLPSALLPGRWGGPPGTVGEPGGNATGGYYSGSATVVDGQPRLVVPAVFGRDNASTSLAHCVGSKQGWYDMHSGCHMSYVMSTPKNLSDPFLTEWTAPVTIIDGRVDGLQPHGPGLDDNTHAWPDPTTPGRWLFAGQATYCAPPYAPPKHPCSRPEYLQLWGSKSGSDWTKGFVSLGDLVASINATLGDIRLGGIQNCPVLGSLTSDVIERDSFLHFGNNAYYIGDVTYKGPGSGQIGFVSRTPQQTLGPGAHDGRGFYDKHSKRWLWWGYTGGGPRKQAAGVPAWDGGITVTRQVAMANDSIAGDFEQLTTYPIAEYATLHARQLYASPDALGGKRGYVALREAGPVPERPLGGKARVVLRLQKASLVSSESVCVQYLVYRVRVHSCGSAYTAWECIRHAPSWLDFVCVLR